MKNPVSRFRGPWFKAQCQHSGWGGFGTLLSGLQFSCVQILTSQCFFQGQGWPCSFSHCNHNQHPSSDSSLHLILSKRLRLPTTDLLIKPNSYRSRAFTVRHCVGNWEFSKTMPDPEVYVLIRWLNYGITLMRDLSLFHP